MDSKNRFNVILPIILSIVFVGGVFFGISFFRSFKAEKSSLYILPRTNKINTVINYIQSQYVDSVSIDKINEKAIISLLKELDPHSAYISASELQQVTEPLEGNFSGIGVQFNMYNDTVIIINTIPNGPSALIGILPGDRIIKVDNVIVAGVKMSSDEIVKKLKGPKGTKVRVTIFRPSINKSINYDIIRNTIPLNSIDAYYMVSPGVGYIRINQFARTTFDEFVRAVNALHKDGMKKIILDLRGNGGGYLDIAINIADQFLDDKKLILYTEGRAKSREDYWATASGICQNDSLVIIIDEFSASASEILAGSIQDNDRGILIGRRSFGKGLVQEQIPLSDGSAIRLTVARYYTPSGRCIQKPYQNGIDEYYNDISKRYVHGEFTNKDRIKFNDTLKYYTNKGRIVYGGGGIMPDIFVPYDTTQITKFYNDLSASGIIYKFAFSYSDNKRKDLSKIKDLHEMRKYLQKDKIYDKFIEYLEKNGIKPDKKSLKISAKLINTYIEAYICRNFFDSQGFYMIIHEIDNTLKTAVDVIYKMK